MRRLLAIGSVTALTATIALALPQQATAATSTPYLLEGLGFGLKLISGSLPASSTGAAHISSGCTNKVPLTTENHAAGVQLPGNLGKIGAVSSHSWTSTWKDGTVNRYTQSKLTDISIGNTAGSLGIDALTVVTRAWHDKKGFHSSTSTSGVGVVAKLGAQTVSRKLPTPSTPLRIPGLLQLNAASKTTTHGAHSALAYANGLVLKLNTDLNVADYEAVLRLGIARAKISDGFKTGIFGGHSAATRINVIGSTVTSSGQPREDMKCQGTDGKVEKLSLASAPVSDIGVPLSLGAATSSQMAKKTATSATGRERSYIAKVDLGNGALIVNGLTAQANATRNGKNFNTVKVNKQGTQAVAITANGQTYTLSQLNGQTLSLPGLEGVAKIQTGVTKGIKAGGKTIGLEVVGLRITLLDVNDQVKSVVDLATAQFQIKHP